jgi:prophage regulatory protein
VSVRTGLSTGSIYKQIRLGLFPRGIKLTARATGWDEDAVQLWIDEKLGKEA